MVLIVYLLIGIFAGTLSGLLGIGGGLVMVPALLMWFKYSQLFPQEIMMSLATGTSLAAMICTSVSSSTVYLRKRCVVWPIFWRFLPGLGLGMVFGSIMARYFSGHVLTKAFAIFLLLIAAYLILSRPAQKPASADNSEVDVARHKETGFTLCLLGIVSVLIGILSTLFGIGGGLIIVPFFLFIGLSMNEASGTCALCGVPISILGTAILILTGWRYTSFMGIPSGTMGYVYWPGAISISLSSMLFANLGARCGIKTHPMARKVFLSCILIICSLNILIYQS